MRTVVTLAACLASLAAPALADVDVTAQPQPEAAATAPARDRAGVLSPERRKSVRQKIVDRAIARI